MGIDGSEVCGFKHLIFIGKIVVRNLQGRGRIQLDIKVLVPESTNYASQCSTFLRVSTILGSFGNILSLNL
jgi:hypothetical protein